MLSHPALSLGEPGQGLMPDGPEINKISQDATAIGDTIVSSTTPIQLKAESGHFYTVIGTSVQSIRLPRETQLMRGTSYFFCNKSSAAMTIRTSGNVIIHSAAAGSVNPTFVICWLLDPLGVTAAATWSAMYIAVSFSLGQSLVITNSMTLSGATGGPTYTMPTSGSCPIASTTFDNVFGFLQTFFQHLRLPPVLFATLPAPAAGNAGMRATISNEAGPLVWGAAVNPTGGLTTPVWSNGAAWLIGG